MHLLLSPLSGLKGIDNSALIKGVFTAFINNGLFSFLCFWLGQGVIQKYA